MVVTLNFVIKKISGRISASVKRRTAYSYLSTENINLSARQLEGLNFRQVEFTREDPMLLVNKTIYTIYRIKLTHIFYRCAVEYLVAQKYL